jgi:hypothetical protein
LPSSWNNFNEGVAAELANEKFKPAPWIKLIAGIRQTAFRSSLAQNRTCSLPYRGETSPNSARAQQHRGIGHLLADPLAGRAHSKLGAHAVLT